MNRTLQLKELDTLLKENSNSAIWTQKMNSGYKWKPLIQFIFALVAIITYSLFSTMAGSSHEGLLNFEFESIQKFFTQLIIWYFAILYFYRYTATASTLVYSIYPDYLRFEWGLFKVKSVDIPFKDITAINLVTYTDRDLSTIYFGTSKEYEVNKMDFENIDSRAHITFEKIKNGKEVYALLDQLQKRAKIS